MRERLLEMLIGQGIITEEEFNERVKAAKETNPLLQDRETLADLTLTTLENDGQIAELVGSVFMSMDMLSEMVVMQSLQIDTLTKEVEALKAN